MGKEVATEGNGFKSCTGEIKQYADLHVNLIDTCGFGDSEPGAD